MVAKGFVEDQKLKHIPGTHFACDIFCFFGSIQRETEKEAERYQAGTKMVLYGLGFNLERLTAG